MNFASFADELVSIKEAAIGHALGGAAIGGVGATQLGHPEYTPEAMMLGTAIGAGITPAHQRAIGRPGFRTGKALATGIGLYALKNLATGVPKQMAYDTAVADQYSRSFNELPPPQPERWM